MQSLHFEECLNFLGISKSRSTCNDVLLSALGHILKKKKWKRSQRYQTWNLDKIVGKKV